MVTELDNHYPHNQEIERRLQRVESMAAANHLRLVIVRRILLEKGLIDSETLDRIWRDTENTVRLMLVEESSSNYGKGKSSNAHW